MNTLTENIRTAREQSAAANEAYRTALGKGACGADLARLSADLDAACAQVRRVLSIKVGLGSR